MNDQAAILQVRNLLLKRAGMTVLHIPDFSLYRGEILSLLGPNGAGKTTLLQALAFLTPYFQGKIFFQGQEINSSKSILTFRRQVTMAFQDPLLFDASVYDNVASGLKIRGIKKKEIQQIVSQNLERFGILHLAQRSARKISAGEAQRVALARAFAIQPEILLLDEPFAKLDQPTRDSLLADLESVLRQTKTTTIIATHDRLEALRLSDRLAIMSNGKILQVGSPEEVMNKPLDEFVAAFVGVESILTGKVIKKEKGSILVAVSGQKVEAIGEMDLGETVALCIRPENVTLTDLPPHELSSARNLFRGRIIKIIPFGLFYRIQIDCGFPLISYITTHSLEKLRLEEGMEVMASFKATSIHVVKKKEKLTVHSR